MWFNMKFFFIVKALAALLTCFLPMQHSSDTQHMSTTLSAPDSDAQTIEFLHARHEQECAARIKWCIDQGLTPASEHVHLAPGTDSNFMFGVPPWLPTGEVNPAGVPYARPSDGILDKSRQLQDYTSKNSKSQAELPQPKKLPTTLKQKRLAEAANGCLRLDVVWSAGAKH